MAKFEQIKKLNYQIDQLKNLVLDIEKYPDFLPWCSYAKIIKINEDGSIIADLGIKYSVFEELYRSHITIDKKSTDELIIKVKMIQGPFKYLYNNWIMQQKEDGTLINFIIDFELKSSVLNKILDVFYYKAAQKMIKAFEMRAASLYQ